MHMAQNVQPPDAPHFMPIEIWRDVIHPEVLKQCDSIDGVRYQVPFFRWYITDV